MTTPTDPRPCERFCPDCGQWKHHSRFATRKRKLPNGSVWLHFDRDCRDCQQKHRNERKNEDRPAAIIANRAADHARKAGATKAFFWNQMNYRALVPVMRAMMTSEGLCPCCGHPFISERDIQLEHKEPPRHRQDWARLHTRNIILACQSCNITKADKAYASWLDEQEQARLSNEADPHRQRLAARGPFEQSTIFDVLNE